jgi:site-specific DNA recombinase
MKNAAIYIRVSTEDQSREGHSLETQLADCERRIDSEGWLKGRVYRDVMSGYVIERPQFQQMLRDADAGKFHVLVVWRLDRFIRNTREGLQAIKHLVEDLGIDIVSVTEMLDFKTARGRRNLREDLSDAEFERDRIPERVMPGMKCGVAKGHWQGARYCFYGYRYDKGAKQLVEIPEEVQIVRMICKLYAGGLAVYSIAMRLYEMGIRNRVGKPFTTRQIHIILHRSLYADGILRWNGVCSNKPVVAPIIDQEIWQKVQAIHAERKREVRAASPGRITSTYTVQGVLKCPFCKGNMVGQRLTANHRTGERTGWYVCGQRLQRTRKACRGKYIKAHTAHALAYEILRKVTQNPQLIELTRRQLKSNLELGQPHLAKHVRELRQTIQNLKQAQAKCLDAFYQEAITAEQLKVENMRLVHEQQLAEQELSHAEAKLEGADAFKGKLDHIFALFQDFKGVWASMTPVQQRVVYRGAFTHLVVNGARWSRRFAVTDFGLKEPFKSWYDGRIWNGPLRLAADELLVVTTSKDSEICESYGFKPTAAR